MFDKNVLIPFLKSIESYGHKNAFCIGAQFYNYRELAEHISKIRNALKASDTKSKNIGLLANDDIETYASIFALWLEGYAYVPMDPRQPIERSQEIISQANIHLVISSDGNHFFTGIQTIESKKLIYDELVLKPNTIPDDTLAYILFTSGSTGKPKGVPITRGNIGSFVKSFLDVGFEISSDDRCLQCFDLTFDVSVQSFLVPLLKGACIYTIPHDQIKYSYVYGLLEDHKLTFGVMAPSMLRYLRPYFDEINIQSMRYCILTAEASPVALIKAWSDCIPNAEIYDFYGPTEATIYCTYYKFRKEGINKQLNGMSSIGKVMHGLTAIIIDEAGEILGPNQKGELCISGGQLTPGYWHDPQKTAESFFERKLNGKVCRFYRTGDSCFFDSEGDIMYAGRIDFQVKIQGYRIELGEIEHHARESVNGHNAVAIAFENNTGNNEIALFIEDGSTDTAVLSAQLKLKLPYYMMPTKIIARDDFPLNANGKVDRNMLKKLLPT